MWRYTADLLYILESPAVREGFFPTSEHRYFVEPASADDWPAIRAIAAACEPPESVAIYEDWWRRLPDAFWTARDGAGRVAGFTAAGRARTCPALVVRCRSARPDLAGRRPAFACATRPADPVHPRVHGSPDDPDQALVDRGADPQFKRVYMEMRPELRRVYNILPERYGPESPWTTLGFHSILDAPVMLGGIAYWAHLSTWDRPRSTAG